MDGLRSGIEVLSVAVASHIGESRPWRRLLESVWIIAEQVHGLDSGGGVVIRRKLRRDDVARFSRPCPLA